MLFQYGENLFYKFSIARSLSRVICHGTIVHIVRNHCEFSKSLGA